MATHSFPVPTHLISICYWYSAWKMLNKATNSSLHIYMLAGSCIWNAVNKYQNGTAKVAKKAFDMGRSGTQYVAMVTEMLSSYWRAHLVESHCKVSNISDANWLRYLFSSYLNKIWLSVWHHHLANLHILKTWISLERKEIFENSKQHFSSHEVYLFMFQNGLDRKDAIFVIVRV